MNNLERLLNNIKLLVEKGGEEYTRNILRLFLEGDKGEEYTRNILRLFLEGDKTADSISRLNELIETEISYWEE